MYSQALAEVLSEPSIVQPFLVKVIGNESVNDIFTPGFESVPVIHDEKAIEFLVLVLSEVVIKEGSFDSPVGVSYSHGGGIASREDEMLRPAWFEQRVLSFDASFWSLCGTSNHHFRFRSSLIWI